MRIVIVPDAQTDLEVLQPFVRNRILAAMARSLHHDADIPATNRKMLTPHPRINALGIAWQLRVGDYRIYYRVEPKQVVVLMVRPKGRSRTEEIL